MDEDTKNIWKKGLSPPGGIPIISMEGKLTDNTNNLSKPLYIFRPRQASLCSSLYPFPSSSPCLGRFLDETISRQARALARLETINDAVEEEML